VAAGGTSKITLLADGTSIRVRDMFVLSATGYVPFERRTRQTGSHSHGVFSGYGLLAMRDSLLREPSTSSWPHRKRIFVKRNSSTRTLTNAQEIEDLLISQGFAVVEPEHMTFREQVELFANADVIVGPTGAAFANLVFCKPTATIIIMISDHKGLSYWYWQNIACAVGNKITYVIGKCKGVFTHPHSNYAIEPTDLLDALGRHTGIGPV
jgi:capsular polysaccharide biosynthesis protein